MKADNLAKQRSDRIWLTTARTYAIDDFVAPVEGYSFPTNLDRDAPIGGLAPKTQQALMHRGLDADWEPARFVEALEKQAWKKLT